MRAVLRGIVLATLTSLLLAMAFIPAMAQQNPYGGGAPTTDEAQGPATVQPGTDATFTGAGFAVGGEVVVRVVGVINTTGTVIANRGGVARATIEIPCPTPAGEATITLTGEGENGGERVVSETFTVTDNTAAACIEGRGLAATGINLSNGVLLALGLLILGGGALAASRRTRTDEATTIDA